MYFNPQLFIIFFAVIALKCCLVLSCAQIVVITIVVFFSLKLMVGNMKPASSKLNVM